MNQLTLMHAGKPWKTLSAKDRAALFGALNESFSEITPLDDAYRAEQIPLTFYPKAKLVFVYDPSWMTDYEGYYFVVSGKKHYRLDGDASVIHAMNADLKLSLTAENVLYYLVFFSAFMGDGADAFPIMANDTKKTGFFISPKLTKTTKQYFRLEAVILHNNSLSKASYEVSMDGHLEMLDDQPLAMLESAGYLNPHLRLPPGDV